MNPRQKLFCEYYCGKYIDDPVKAALAAGYAQTTARANVSRLLKNVEIQKYIAELNSKAQSKFNKKIATIADVKAFWTDVMNNKNEIMKNRLRASELIAKAGGAFNNDW